MKSLTSRHIAPWLGGVGLLALAVPAFAQDAAHPTTANADTAGSGASTGIADIVVTAQKRSQRLQDVPASVSAISADALKARGVADATDLMGSMPSLQVTTPYGKTQPNFSLRGVSIANEFSASTTAPIGVYVDEVYESFRASQGQQLFDLDHVEVLRGPQGTLYGRNTTGGAISFFSMKPKLTGDEAYLTLGYANYNTKNAEGAAEYTLVPDKLGLRIAGSIADGDGWMWNVAQNRKIGTTNNEALRATLRWMPTPDLDITFKAFGSRDNPLAAAAYATGQLAGGRDILGYSRNDPSQNGGAALGPNAVNSDTAGNYFTSTWGGTLTIKYDLDAHLSITSITGFDRGTYNNSPFDCDGSPNSVCALTYYSRSSNFNQDLRFAYKSPKLNLIGGLYYGVDRVDNHNHLDFFGALQQPELAAGLPGTYFNPPVLTGDSLSVVPAFNPTGASVVLPANAPNVCAPINVGNPGGFLDSRSLIALLTDIAINNTSNGGAGGAYSAACRAAGAAPVMPIMGEQFYTISRPSTAIYGDATFEATDHLTVALGLRYTFDRVHLYNARSYLYDLNGTTISASTIPYSYPYNPALADVSQGEAANRLTGRLNVSYKFSSDIMAYVDYSRGYRSGTYNGLAYQGMNQLYYVQPETVDDFEGGIKTRLFDRKVVFNLSGFYYKYKNQQFDEIIGATSFVRNGDGHIYGAELELNARVLPTLTLNASLGLLHSEYTGPGSNPPTTANIIGNPFPNAPGVTFSGGFDWDAWHNSTGKLTLHGEGNYMGKYYFDPFKSYGQTPCNAPPAGSNTLAAGADIACGNPGYWLFNARATYKMDRVSFSLWGKNIFNKYYYTYGLNIHIFELDYLNRGMPRTFGGEMTVRF